MAFFRNCTTATLLASLYQLKVILFTVIFTLIGIPSQMLPVLCIFLPLQKIVHILGKIFRPDLHGVITGRHALFSFSNYTMNCFSVATVQGQVNLEKFQQIIQERSFTLRRPNGELEYQGLKRYPVCFLGYAFWKTDDHFNLTNHVRPYDYEGGLKFPISVENKDFQSSLAHWLRIPWKEAQSPWEILIQYDKSSSKENFKTLFLIRFSHLLCDGYSFFKFFKVATQTNFKFPQINISHRELTLGQRFGLLFKMPYDTAANILLARQGSKLQSNFDYSSRELVLSVSPVMSVEAIKTVKNCFNVSYSAVLCAIYFGAIDRAVKYAGLKTVPDLASTSLVVPEENHPGGLVIHAGMMFAAWPIKSECPVQRLQMIHNSLKIISQSSALYLYTLLADSLSYYPIMVRTVLNQLLMATWKNSVDVTHLPVTISREYVLGSEITDVTSGNVPWPTGGMTCTSGGINHNFRFSFVSKKGFFGNSNVASHMGSFAEEELHALLQLATAAKT